jgi:2-octaprenyl-6-methoxyphenol hydroxylase
MAIVAPIREQSLESSRAGALDPTLSFDVAIAGGGIVGLTLAAALKHSGLKVAIIEPQTQCVAAAKGQAYALHLSSRQILTGLGIWNQILPKIEAFRWVEMADADCPHQVNFQPADLGVDQGAALESDAVGHVAEHQVLLTALQTYLQACPNVTWFCPYQVTETEFAPEAVTVQLAPVPNSSPVSVAAASPICLRAKLLVAADGAQSPIRQRLGIATQGWKYWQSCIVVTVAPERPQPQTAYEHFWPSGPFAALPLPNQQWRIVWTAPHAEAQAILALDEPAFLAELTQRFGTQMGQLRLTSRPFIFPAKLMQASQYIAPRLALIGDAAHSCHPVGGQGLNLGIRDAAALAEVLEAAHAQAQDLGSLAVLKRYQRWRRWENGLTLAFTDLLNRSFSNQFWPLQTLRRLGLWLMQRVPLVKTLALKFMAGLLGRQTALARLAINLNHD